MATVEAGKVKIFVKTGDNKFEVLDLHGNQDDLKDKIDKIEITATVKKGVDPVAFLAELVKRHPEVKWIVREECETKDWDEETYQCGP